MIVIYDYGDALKKDDEKLLLFLQRKRIRPVGVDLLDSQYIIFFINDDDTDFSLLLLSSSNIGRLLLSSQTAREILNNENCRASLLDISKTVITPSTALCNIPDVGDVSPSDILRHLCNEDMT